MKALLCTHKADFDLDFSWLEQQGEVVRARDWTSVLQFMAIEYFDVVFMDVLTVKGDYALFNQRLAKLKNLTPIIYFTPDLALDREFFPVHPNLFGFLFHPEDGEIGKDWCQRIMVYQKLIHDSSKQMRPFLNPRGLGSFIGNHPQMADLYRLLIRAIQTDYTILITGPSGTGKEVASKTIHDLSDRSKNRFVSINCAAIPDNLLESELFGYEPGAFTGAQKSKPGKFELADKGTLFLDEVGDMPLQLQSKLLRVLEEQQVERLGSSGTIQINVRVLAATNRNLAQRVENGQFRSDLYYRLNVVPILLPPLDQRRSDIQLLTLYFLDKVTQRQELNFKGVEVAALEALQDIHFPGHVRELENLITRLVFMSEGRRLSARDVSNVYKLTAMAPSAGANKTNARDEIRPLWEIEKEAIELAMSQLDGNISRAAEKLEISRNALYHKLKIYGIETTKNHA
ncbi:MAG: hypothetical protein AUJ47_03830 [Candidatus Marinimicrobia bacterium CG1_02_48_14]|nr:MAG: hypothetical protein AUJ47_03830 [Candidatus Marinimicrobia bacterium CG1_02_48_14]